MVRSAPRLSLHCHRVTHLAAAVAGTSCRFEEEEHKFRIPSQPVTKADVAEWRAKMKELDARPIKKVAEAKARKKRRVR